MQEYEVIKESDFHVFVRTVEARLMAGNGWRPCGGIAVTTESDGNRYYYQALTRKLTEEETAHEEIRLSRLPEE